MKSLKLILAMIILSSSHAYADPFTIISILYKIYSQAEENSHQIPEPNQAPATIAPENFDRSSNLTNSAIESKNPNEDTNQQSTAQNNESNPQNSEFYNSPEFKAALKEELAKINQPADENSPQYQKVLREKIVEHNQQIPQSTVNPFEEARKNELANFNKRKISNRTFVAACQLVFYPFVRPNILLKNATDDEKIAIEEYFENRESRIVYEKQYHEAFKKGVYKTIELLGLSFQELQSLKEQNAFYDKEFNINPVDHALLIKSYKSGVLQYEHNHPESKTHCLWAIGGRSEYMQDCDKVYDLVMFKYKSNHKIISTKLSKEEIKTIAYQLNPHEVL